MSKRYFEDLAAALARTKPGDDLDPNTGLPQDPIVYAHQLSQWNRTVLAVADVCGSHNPRFDRGRFLSACGMVH